MLAGFLAPLGLGRQASADPPHLVVILTDDQRFDTLWAMPILQQKLGSRGVTFSNALVTTPICCPMRASFLSGGFLVQNTGVLNNSLPSGSIARFVERDTLALRLQRAGYRTMMTGKYLNGWQHPHVPPGWTEFAAAESLRFTVGSTGEEPGTGTAVPYSSYRTDAERDRVLDFIARMLPSGRPLFILFAAEAPHQNMDPAPQDADLFPGYVYRGRGWICCYWDTLSFSSLEEQDEFHRDQLRSLQAVDRAVGAIVDRLEQAGQLDRTLFVYTTDNGLMWGEHGKFGKASHWEEAIRVPLVVAAPGVPPRSDPHLVAVNLDVPSALLDYAGLPTTGDGESLRSLLEDPGAPWRDSILIENYNRTWSGFRTRDSGGQEWKYAEEVGGGRRHLYDLSADPFELDNLYYQPAQQGRVADFANRLAPRKGIASRYASSALSGSFGQPLSIPLGIWGGTPPFHWPISAGTLPVGLTLEDDGTIAGVPLEVVSGKPFDYELTGSRWLTQPGRPESFLARISATIKAGDADVDGVGDVADNCPFDANPGQQDGDGDGVGDACSACSDGIDNDGDGRVDFDGAASLGGGEPLTEQDPGCVVGDVPDPASDPSEQSPALVCDDGVDNDGDGLADAADPGCGGPSGVLENPQCDDGLDNDGDGGIDHDGTPPDADCVGRPSRKREAAGPLCGAGPELWLPLALLALGYQWIARARRVRLSPAKAAGS
jgi:arylsulfatase A-like enzyme